MCVCATLKCEKYFVAISEGYKYFYWHENFLIA